MTELFDIKEINEWENELDKANRERVYGNKIKCYFDPRKDALIRHRKRSKWRRYIESPYARKMVQKSFKMRMKQLVSQEDYHAPVPHEYKTYGWETW